MTPEFIAWADNIWWMIPPEVQLMLALVLPPTFVLAILQGIGYMGYLVMVRLPYAAEHFWKRRLDKRYGL